MDLSSFTPCGSQTLSKMPSRYIEGIYPKVLVKGKGSVVYDDKGHAYIDLISGLGAITVGYANDSINDAIYSQMRKGILFSLPNPIEYQAAKRLTELVPGTEQWKFGKNGTDGTVMAVRAARAFTGRTKIMTVGYNGCADQFEIRGTRTAGIPRELDSTIDKAFYNNYVSFGRLEHKEYACVLMEPMIYEYPGIDFLQAIRDLCTRTGTLLIFDEVVNGGRFKTYTSSHYFKIFPDMYVLGKGLANGMPLCAVGASRSIMSTFERDDFFASGTFGGECASLASFLATSDIIVNRLDQMIWNGRRIKDAFETLHWPEYCACQGYPTRLNFVFPTLAHKALFWQEMCLRGILVGYANFVKADNTEEEITQIIDALFKSFKVLKENWKDPMKVMKGKLPQEALKGRSN